MLHLFLAQKPAKAYRVFAAYVKTCKWDLICKLERTLVPLQYLTPRAHALAERNSACDHSFGLKLLDAFPSLAFCFNRVQPRYVQMAMLMITNGPG